MKLLIFIFTVLPLYQHVSSEIRHHRRSKMLSKPKPLRVNVPNNQSNNITPSFFKNVVAELTKRLAHVKPVGGSKGLIPLTEIPPPQHPEEELIKSGRRHLPDECTKKPGGREVNEGPEVHIIGDYYSDEETRTVATVIIPEHIDYIHYEVTLPPPYYTVDNTIEGIGYHPSTAKPEHPNECERIYQEHLADQYSDESQGMSEESMEMARVPLLANSPDGKPDLDQIYSDLVDGP